MRPIVDTALLTEEEWLTYRDHAALDKTDPNWVPFAVGGSDTGPALNISPFGDPAKLRAKKLGLLKDKKTNQYQLLMGHLAEPISAYLFEERINDYTLSKENNVYRIPCTGNGKYEVWQDTWMYQHDDYPWALANFDRRYRRPDGSEGILELKTTNWRMAEKWKDGEYPSYYESQLRFYMAVANVQYGAFCCMSGFNPDSECFIVEIERDFEKEAELFAVLQELIDDLNSGKVPSFDDVDVEDALADLALMYPEATVDADCELSAAMFGRMFEDYVATEAKIKELKRQIDAHAQKQDMYKVKIQTALGVCANGICEVQNDDGSSTIYKASWSNRGSRSCKFGALEEKYPDAYAECVTESTSRTFKVSEVKPKTKKSKT